MEESNPGGGKAISSRRVYRYIPGLVLLSACAVFSRMISPHVPGVNHLLMAVIVGVLWANTVGVPTWAEPGVETHDILLGAAIVLMGATLTVHRIVDSGVVVLLAVVFVTTFTLLYVEVISQSVFGLTDKLASLLAAGSSICGVSAVVAVAGSIRADEEQVVYAATTILLFDALTLLVYPVIGTVYSLPDQVFGVWAGLSMFSTGPVVAAGFAHSEIAGQWATITKLARNTLIGVVAVGYATYYTRKMVDEDGDSSGRSARWIELWDRFPKFVAGFIALMLLTSLVALTDAQLQSIEHSYNWLFLLAFVGLGANLRITEFRQSGVKPVLVVFVTLCTVSALSLIATWLVFG